MLGSRLIAGIDTHEKTTGISTTGAKTGEDVGINEHQRNPGPGTGQDNHTQRFLASKRWFAQRGFGSSE
jgi:hypothetical protein